MTIFEVIISIALLALISVFSLGTNLDGFRGYSFRGEEDTLISALEKARAYSLNNICLGSMCTGPLPHGIHIESDRYIIYQGLSYNTNDKENEIVLVNPKIHLSGPSQIIFSPLSGDLSTFPPNTWNIILSDLHHSEIISLNTEGQITTDN